MTRHERYLKERPRRIALKRLKRRRAGKRHTDRKRLQVGYFRRVLQDYLARQPKQEPVRAGKKAWHDPLTRHFRKPTV